MDDAILRAEDLKFEYDADGGAVKVFEDLDIEVRRGETLAILGHNGCGKSTLAKHFNAVLLPTGGKVYVGGMDTADEEKLIDIRRTVGMVFQNPDNQIVASVVEEDVAFAPENLGVPSAEIRERVDRALATVGMTEYARHAPHKLSGGQKQRIAIAGVLAMRPECIVLDEPTAMLDPVGRHEVMRTILELNRSAGTTIVLITHHMEEAAQCGHVAVMDHGRIITSGTPTEVFTKVELLREVGLEVPQTVELLYELRKAGIQVPLDALGVDECAAAIAAAIG